ncbi:MAG TPA: orotidine-5'-phosphate decarboxylase [Casimicrobiaceae bacterium]|jgi:orotidine-5'-phosphate decarboxylase|nr:orotidine-5'-phosphate decarboxylase [Casimicrobiaceae bacterium]
MSPNSATAAAGPKVIVALDFAEAAQALALVARLNPKACAVKVGNEMFVSAGPELVQQLIARGFRVFLDLKFYDIPNTVAQACAAATRLGVWMINVHAAGGRAMLKAARDAVERSAAERGGPRPMLLAVTLLTSLGAEEVAEIGYAQAPEGVVLRLARLAADCGLDGVVCSAVEAPALRRTLGAGFKLVTPGIRPAGTAAADQVRLITPEAAIANGADYLVIGRPITRAADPEAELARINASLEVAA